MRNDVNRKLREILNGMDKDKINQSKSRVQSFLNSPEGKKLMSELSEIDKNKLSDAFMKMDSNKIKQQIGNMNPNDILNLKAEDIKNKMR